MENKTKTIIERAIKGGYTWEVRGTVTRSEAFLDPLFWQSLGMACGWDVSVCRNCAASITYGEITTLNQQCIHHPIREIGNDWKAHALHFYEINLTEGMDSAIDYLYGLLPFNK